MIKDLCSALKWSIITSNNQCVIYSWGFIISILKVIFKQTTFPLQGEGCWSWRTACRWSSCVVNRRCGWRHKQINHTRKKCTQLGQDDVDILPLSVTVPICTLLSPLLATCLNYEIGLIYKYKYASRGIDLLAVGCKCPIFNRCTDHTSDAVQRNQLFYGVKRQPLILLAGQARGKGGFSHILFQSVYRTHIFWQYIIGMVIHVQTFCLHLFLKDLDAVHLSLSSFR